MSRPEDTLPPELYYNDRESLKYTTSSRIQHIQTQMTHRALTLLSLSSPSFILDLGCGTGLSGTILSNTPSSEGGPHVWVGMDISSSMLATALSRDDDDDDDDGDDDSKGRRRRGRRKGDYLLSDIGQGVPFRPGSFDAAISISAIQWLCNADRSDVSAHGRLTRFFDGLYASLKRGGRAVCQFYPKNEIQRNMICGAAIKAGFGAGVLEDDPGTKNSKLYLVLTAGGSCGGQDITTVVKHLPDDERVDIVDHRSKTKQKNKKGDVVKKGSRRWILQKKEQMERKGKIVKPNSKYTGRKRGPKF